MGVVNRAALLALLLAGCLPAAHDYVGGACDPTHGCPRPLECRAGTCQVGGSGGGGGGGAQGTRDNRTPSGDFEDGMPVFNWTSPNTMAGDGQTKRSGAFSARLSGAGAAFHGLQNVDFRIAIEGAPATFCSEAWVMGLGSATATMTLKRTLAGPVKSVDRPESHATLSSTWSPVRTRIIVEPNSLDLSWELRVTQPAADTFVDDVMVWPSADGGCNE